jgi:hypothetical protein
MTILQVVNVCVRLLARTDSATNIFIVGTLFLTIGAECELGGKLGSQEVEIGRWSFWILQLESETIVS